MWSEHIYYYFRNAKKKVMLFYLPCGSTDQKTIYGKFS